MINFTKTVTVGDSNHKLSTPRTALVDSGAIASVIQFVLNGTELEITQYRDEAEKFANKEFLASPEGTAHLASLTGDTLSGVAEEIASIKTDEHVAKIVLTVPVVDGNWNFGESWEVLSYCHFMTSEEAVAAVEADLTGEELVVTAYLTAEQDASTDLLADAEARLAASPLAAIGGTITKTAI